MTLWSIAIAAACLGLSIYLYAIKKEAPQAIVVLGFGLSVLGRSSDLLLLAGTVLIVLGAGATLWRVASNGNGEKR